MRPFFYFFLMVLGLTSCSFFVSESNSPWPFDRLPRDVADLKKADYLEQLNWYGEGIIRNSKIIELTPVIKGYFQNIQEKIIGSNPKIFKQSNILKIILVRNDMPFHFSLPNGKMVLSSGAFKELIDSEGILITLLTRELLRNHFNIYQKNRVIPQGVFELSELKKSYSIDMETRQELNKWAYYCIENTGQQPGAVLKLIQKKNKLLSSPWYQEETRNLSLEESSFKFFLVQQKRLEKINNGSEEVADKEFYKLINFIRVGNG